MSDALGPGSLGSVNPVTSRPAFTPGNAPGDPPTWFKDCSTPSAGDGTGISAAFLNAVLAQMRETFSGMGVALDNTDDQMLLKAIRAAPRIAALKLPIYPEITEAGGVFTFTTTTGQIVVNSALTWQHRGLIAHSTSEFDAPSRTFATAASKTYHLVWDAPGAGLATPGSSYPNGRFSLIDRTGASPVETDASYDSTYDRMLLARVVTSGGNALTVTSLINQARLVVAVKAKQTFSRSTDSQGQVAAPFTPVPLGWSRTPRVVATAKRSGYPAILPQIPEEAEIYLSGSVTDGAGAAAASVDRYTFAPVGTADINVVSTTYALTWTLDALLTA